QSWQVLGRALPYLRLALRPETGRGPEQATPTGQQVPRQPPQVARLGPAALQPVLRQVAEGLPAAPEHPPQPSVLRVHQPPPLCLPHYHYRRPGPEARTEPRCARLSQRRWRPPPDRKSVV